MKNQYLNVNAHLEKLKSKIYDPKVSYLRQSRRLEI